MRGNEKKIVRANRGRGGRVECEKKNLAIKEATLELKANKVSVEKFSKKMSMY